MSRIKDLELENRQLRERLSRMGQASLRINESLDFETVLIDYARRRATVGGRLVKLTVIEYRLLVELSVQAGVKVAHEDPLQKVWRKRSGGDTRPIRTAIKSLRRKLGDDANAPTYIFNEPRVGYRLGNGEQAEGRQPVAAGGRRGELRRE